MNIALLPRRLRVRTGGMVDAAFGVLLAAAALVLYVT
jgi:hypothetical protein